MEGIQFSTRRRIVLEPPLLENAGVTRRTLLLPKNSNRFGKGGMRTRNKFKCGNINSPLVSIITVNRNGGRFLERCVLSVLEQTYDNIEYIIIDGGSSDQSIPIIRKYEEALDYWVSEPDSGIYDAMNKGLELASGDIIAFLNADDYYYTFAAERSVSNLLRSGQAISAAHMDIIDDQKAFLSTYHLYEFNDAAYLGGIPASHQSMFCRRACFESVGLFDTRFRVAGDTDWILKAIEKGFKASLLKVSLGGFTWGGASADLTPMWRENAIVLQKRLPELSLEEIDNLSKFAYGWKGAYDFRATKEILRKGSFSQNQTTLLQRRVLEEDPNCWKLLHGASVTRGYKDSTTRTVTDKSLKIGNNRIVAIANSVRDFSPKHFKEGGLRLANCYKESIAGKPLVTIITVVFNCKSFLERCILSVLHQSYDNIEYIIVDGQSNDGTLDIIRKYEKAIDYWVSQKDEGHGDAMNKGLRLASGDIIAILNADDMYFPDAAEEAVKAMQGENADYAIGGCTYLDNAGAKCQTNYLTSIFPSLTTKPILFLRNAMIVLDIMISHTRLLSITSFGTY
jgi:glycosyltransferase involved in cell wall biosynthesis